MLAAIYLDYLQASSDALRASSERALIEFLSKHSDHPQGAASVHFSSAPTTWTSERLHQELREFSKSALIYRPLNSAMASRFRSSADTAGLGAGIGAATGMGDAPLRIGLYQPPPPSSKPMQDKAAEQAQTDTAAIIEAAQRTPAQAAARRGEFGPLTRETRVWIPERLLCKRFGVTDPHPGARETAAAAAGGAGREAGAAGEEVRVRDADAQDDDSFDSSIKSHGTSRAATKAAARATWDANKRSIEAMVRDRAWNHNRAESDPRPVSNGVEGSEPDASEDDAALPSDNGHAGKAKNMGTVGLGEDADQGRDTLTYVKPAPDIFRAIFGDDDSDEQDAKDDAKDDARDPGANSGAALAGERPVSTGKALVVPRVLSEDHDAGNGGESGGPAPLLIRPTFTAKSKRDGDTSSGKPGKKRKKEKRSVGMTLSFDTADDEEQQLMGTQPVKKTIENKDAASKRLKAADLF